MKKFFYLFLLMIPVLYSIQKTVEFATHNDDINTCMDIKAVTPVSVQAPIQEVQPGIPVQIQEEPQETEIILPEDAGEPEAVGDEVIDTMAYEPVFTPQDDSDIKERKEVENLVNDALNYVKSNPFDRAMSAFTKSRDFVRGPIYLFVYDYNGFEYANGQDERMIWKNLIDLKDQFGTPIIQTIIKKAKQGGGWVTYSWRNATKNSFVKPFVKNGKEYVVGAGYYPHSKRDVVAGLVKAAVAYFHDIVHVRNLPVDEVFSTLSYPAGRFVFGDLYLYAVDFNGRMMANGDRPGLIGTNVLDVKDSQGKFVNRDIIDSLKRTVEGVWVSYTSKNARKLAYAQKVVDKQGREYFIAAGYYPDASPNKAVDLVKNGYEFMKTNGISAAVSEFSSRGDNAYVYGDIYLVVWDLKGKVIAHGANLDSIGLNQWDIKDEDGRFYVQELIKKAKAGGGWVDIKLRNAIQSMYVEKVEMGTDDYVIGAGLFPISKHETALLLARSAAGYLQTHTEPEAFNEFSNVEGKFMRGDLFVFVIDFEGFAKVWGDRYELIWQNVMTAKDDTGKPYVQLFINTVKQGPAKVSYKLNKFQKTALLEKVEKDRKSYVVGSAYYVF